MTYVLVGTISFCVGVIVGIYLYEYRQNRDEQ